MDTFSEKIFIDDMTPAQRRLLLSTRHAEGHSGRPLQPYLAL
jgi:hypothetical protein